MTRLPTYFISHGGGPWPWIPQMRAQFVNLEASLKKMVADLPELPKAVLSISGHWEGDDFAVMANPNPPMVYDYYGFPKHTYEITYPAPGAPELAARTRDLLAAAGLPTHLDTTQGYDHGTFAPLYIMFPEANVPVYQISLNKNYSPAEHLAMGRALAPLRDEGVMIIGSGLSFHNLRMFGPVGAEPSAAFDAWLYDAMRLDPETRADAVRNWESAPAARISHKEEDHLVPLFVALGAAEQEPATRIFHDVGERTGITVSNYRFG